MTGVCIWASRGLVSWRLTGAGRTGRALGVPLIPVFFLVFPIVPAAHGRSGGLGRSLGLRLPSGVLLRGFLPGFFLFVFLLGLRRLIFLDFTGGGYDPEQNDDDDPCKGHGAPSLLFSVECGRVEGGVDFFPLSSQKFRELDAGTGYNSTLHASHSTLFYFFPSRGLGASVLGAAALAMPVRISVSAMVFCIW